MTGSRFAQRACCIGDVRGKVRSWDKEDIVNGDEDDAEEKEEEEEEEDAAATAAN